MSERTAVFGGPGNKYRYSLTRTVGIHGQRVVWVMLNPSTAGAVVDDQTIRRVCGFSWKENFGIVEVVNLFALRATNPRQLKFALDPIGPDNKKFMLRAIKDAAVVVLAWGNGGMHVGAKLFDSAKYKLQLIQTNSPVLCLGTTLQGEPRHPLRLNARTKLRPYTWPH